MAQFVVRQLEEDVAKKLRQRAKKNARSMEDEVRHILRSVVRQHAEGPHKLGSRIARRFRRAGMSGDLPEFKGGAARAADLDS
jgi:plasmid stability protein